MPQTGNPQISLPPSPSINLLPFIFKVHLCCLGILLHIAHVTFLNRFPLTLVSVIHSSVCLKDFRNESSFLVLDGYLLLADVVVFRFFLGSKLLGFGIGGIIGAVVLVFLFVFFSLVSAFFLCACYYLVEARHLSHVTETFPLHL